MQQKVSDCRRLHLQNNGSCKRVIIIYIHPRHAKIKMMLVGQHEQMQH
jgi:hypothetical protein